MRFLGADGPGPFWRTKMGLKPSQWARRGKHPRTRLQTWRNTAQTQAAWKTWKGPDSPCYKPSPSSCPHQARRWNGSRTSVSFDLGLLVYFIRKRLRMTRCNAFCVTFPEAIVYKCSVLIRIINEELNLKNLFNIVSCWGLCPCLTQHPAAGKLEFLLLSRSWPWSYRLKPSASFPWPLEILHDPQAPLSCLDVQPLCSFSPRWISLEYKHMALTTVVTN